MSLIRLFTKVGKRKRPSQVYVWHDIDGYFYFTASEGSRRVLDSQRAGLPGLKLTKDEFQYVVGEAIRQYGWKGHALHTPRKRR